MFDVGTHTCDCIQLCYFLKLLLLFNWSGLVVVTPQIFNDKVAVDLEFFRITKINDD